MLTLIRATTLAIATLAGLSLGGCATMPGNLNGLGRDGMSMVVVHRNKDYGQLTDKGYQVVVAHVNDCLYDVHRQQAGLAEVMVTNGLVEAAGVAGGEAGSVPLQASMLGQHLVRHAVPAVTAAGAALGGAQGALNGLPIKSNAVTNIVGSCANGDLHDPETLKKHPEIAGTHVIDSSIRTNLRSNKLPAWIKRDSVTAAPAGKGDTRDPDSE